MRYTLHILDSSSTSASALIAIENRVESCVFAYGEHGAADLTATLRLSLAEQFRLYSRSGAPHVIVAYMGRPIWAGRLEAVTVSGGLCTVTAAGYWRALTDVPYTALWAMADTSQFRPMQATEDAAAAPGKYEFDTTNGIWIAPKRGETHAAPSPYVGYIAYQVPNQGSRVITHTECTWNITAPDAGWRFGIVTYDPSVSGSAWTPLVNYLLQSGSGSGYANTAFSGTPTAVAFYFYDSTASGALAVDTGVNYAALTGVRVYSRLLYVYATQIVEALASYINSINPTQLAAAARATQVPAANARYNEVYEDLYPSEIVEELCRQERYQAWVNLQQQLVFEPIGTDARTWKINAGSLEVDRVLEGVRNRRYAVYQESGGRTLRTAASDNLKSQTQYGIIRSAPVEARTTDATAAAAFRDLALADTADPTPRSSFAVRQLLGEQGHPVPLHAPRAGDEVIIQNIPVGLIGSANPLARFRVARTEIALSRGSRPQLTLEPADPIPTLESTLSGLEISQ